MATQHRCRQFRAGSMLALALALLLAGCTGENAGTDAHDDDNGDGGRQPQTCGGLLGSECGAGFYCDYPADTCGATDEPGVCSPRPDGCDDVHDPVCACDGVEYENACSAAAMGADVSGAECAGAGSFACADAQCSAGADYCSILVPGVPGSAPSYTCTALPEDCAAPSCDCFSGPDCDCTTDDAGNVTLTCYAP